jgi:PKHD-type hydroxylase
MDLTNFYYYFKSAIDPNICKTIIENGNKKIQELKNKGIKTEAETAGQNHKQALEEINKNVEPLNDKSIYQIKKQKKNLNNVYYRDSEVCWMDDNWLYDLIYPYIHEANNKAGWKYDFDCSESFQFTKYGINQFYGWHSDGGSDHFSKYKRAIPGVTIKKNADKYFKGYVENKSFIGKIRKLSLTINLNEPNDYEGGNLKFDFGPHTDKERFHECIEIRPQGSIIIFPSFLHHQVTPVTKGTRYSLVLWTLGKPFR